MLSKTQSAFQLKKKKRNMQIPTLYTNQWYINKQKTLIKIIIQSTVSNTYDPPRPPTHTHILIGYPPNSKNHLFCQSHKCYAVHFTYMFFHPKDMPVHFIKMTMDTNGLRLPISPPLSESLSLMHMQSDHAEKVINNIGSHWYIRLCLSVCNIYP